MSSATFAHLFANPPIAVRPLTYWWLPDPDVMTVEGVRRDIEAMAAAGIGGILPYRADFALPVDPKHVELLKASLETAGRHGMKVDLSFATTPGAPTITAESSAAQQELVYGRAFLGAGEAFRGPVPPPSTQPDRPRSLVAVLAARCTTSCQTEKPVLLDRDSLVDLTASTQNGTLDWTTPLGTGQWIVLSFWARNVNPPYADHFSVLGAKALTDYLDTHTLTSQIKPLLVKAGGVLHEDSIHFRGFHLWSRDFLSEFEQRRGYSLRKYLPVSIIANVNNFSDGGRQPERGLNTDSPADFDFGDDTGKRIRNDYFQTLNELWEQEYLMTLQRWAKSRGLGFRSQVAYGQTLSTATAAHVDVPMTEAFQLGDVLDGYRSMAGAVHMGGRPLFSSECCVSVGRVREDNYSTTWKQMLAVIHNNFIGGINEITLHGVTYPGAPDATWPGFTNFGGRLLQSGGREVDVPGFGEEFGPRMPYWHHMPDLMNFLSRQQLVLRQGQPQVDVAIYRQSYWDYGFPIFPGCHPPTCDPFFKDKTLERTGYTYEFVDPALFDLPGAMVRDGRLSPGGPAYKALVLAPGQRTSVDGMPLAAAQHILRYAQEGLPIVVVGESPRQTGFFGDAAQDPELRRTVARILEQPRVRRVTTEADVATALGELGVYPAARPVRTSNFLSARRLDGEANYYLLWNQNRVDKATGEPNPVPEPFDQPVSLEGLGQPFLLDAWTGKITPIALYERAGDRVTTRVKLAPGESILIAIGPEEWQRSALGATATDATRLHATSTTADEVVVGAQNELRIRAGRAGTYTTTLSDGRRMTSTVATLPAPQTLSGWHLSVEDWQPGKTATETVKVQHELDLAELRTWPQLEALADVSGIGRYTKRVVLDGDWIGAGRGARLELGPLFDSVRLTVNGQSAGYVDPHNPALDVSRYLRAGANEIEIEVATTLRNRVRLLRPGFKNVDRQPYGLVGPVRLVPYAEASMGSVATASTTPSASRN